MKERDSLRGVAKISGFEEDWSSYKKMKNKCIKMLKNKKNYYISALYQDCNLKNDVKTTYRMTKEILGWTSPGQPNCFLIEGKIIRKPSDIANELQKCFVQKIKNLMKNLKKSNHDPLIFLKMALSKWGKFQSLPVFTLREISLAETEIIIRGLGNSSACGRDGIDAKDY